MITTKINSCLRMAILLHENLHRFKKGKGMGTATVEAKLRQHLTGICH